MNVKENLSRLKQESIEKISAAVSPEQIEDIRVNILGRKGELTDILRSLSKLTIEEKKELGKESNILKEELESLLATKTRELKNKSISEKLINEKTDMSLPPFPIKKGHVHPIRRTLKEITEIFTSIGFKIAKGPEIETEWYNFEALNIPKDHPARDVQDTFFLKNSKNLLRTHTSPVQIHVMENQKPPVRIIAPGRVYRNEATDASHAALFHQIEGLAIEENVTFADLKGTLTLFIHRFFGSNVGVRFRPSHYQFTEPSADIDIQCTICGGKGCRICKNTGWLEMLGCGMVHPNVLRTVKYDTEIYSGFAFGLGVERLTMFKYQIDDIRLFHENNIKFLEQF